MNRDRVVTKLMLNRTENPCVGGSIPSRATQISNNIKTYRTYKILNKFYYTTTRNYTTSQSSFFVVNKTTLINYTKRSNYEYRYNQS